MPTDVFLQPANMSLQSSVKNVFIRGSVVRYVHLPASSVDTQLLEDATRRGMIIDFTLFSLNSETLTLETNPFSLSLEASTQQAKAK